MFLELPAEIHEFWFTCCELADGSLDFVCMVCRPCHGGESLGLDLPRPGVGNMDLSPF